MPEGGDFLQIIEEFHYQKNCEQLVKNMQLLKSDNKLHNKSTDNFELIETYGVPITNLQKCNNYSLVSKFLIQNNLKLEVKNTINKSYNLELDTEKNLFIIT